MRLIKKYIGTTAAIIGVVLFSGCEEDTLDLKIAYPNDITFNELPLDRFTYDIYDAPFVVGDDASGVITVNASSIGNGDFSGFALSNRNFRSYPWDLSPNFTPEGGLSPDQKQEAINSTAFSVYTNKVNTTENYLVGNTAGDDAFFSLETPTTIAHILVANTSYNYLLAEYGSILSADLDPVTQQYLLDGERRSNPGIANDDTNRYGVFTLPGVDGTLNTIRLDGTQILAKDEAGVAAGIAARDAFINESPDSTLDEQQSIYDAAYKTASDNLHTGYVKLTIEGFLNETKTGDVEVYLSILENVDSENPNFDYILRDWRKVDLTTLGDVDKVLFKMSSSYVDDQGNMIYPSTFCLDGIRLQ